MKLTPDWQKSTVFQISLSLTSYNKMPKKYVFYSFQEAKSLVLSLGIKSRREYQKAQQEDEKLPSDPNVTYRDHGWVDWYDFLGTATVSPNYYATYIEAQEAAQRLGIKTGTDYKKKYLQDPKLPAVPSRLYAKKGWTNWYDFLGKKKRNFYSTYEEAKLAAKALNFKHRADYVKRFSEDPRLPSSPKDVYQNSGWTNFNDFLSICKRYSTLTEASKAAISLGIKSSRQYRTEHYKDARLPSQPDQTYRYQGWSGWNAFLGIESVTPYSTYAEAQAAAKKLGAKTMAEYLARYKEDPKLMASPGIQFKENGWSTSYDFLGTKAPFSAEKHFPIIWGEFERWLKSCRGLPQKRIAIRLFLCEFYYDKNLPDEPIFLLLKSNFFDSSSYQLFIESKVTSAQPGIHRAVSTFYNWLLDEHCIDIDNGERVVIDGFRNPFTTILNGYSDSLDGYRPSQSTKVPLGYEYILRSRHYLVPNGEQALFTRPSLTDLPHLQGFFNNRADWLTVDQSMIDETDPNCIWRRLTQKGRPDKYQVWSPVRFIAMYTLMRFPLRGQQILWLDSGEADNEIPVIDAVNGGIRWVENAGPHVGYGNKKRRSQGAIQKGANGEQKFYITTNKTGFGAEGGYEVEWVPDDIVYWFLLLREWQAKYNPISKPTSWTSIGLDRNEVILKARGTQCFLFRGNDNGKPMLASTAYLFTLPGLLYQIQREGENLAFKVPEGNHRTPYVSLYTPHSLRVSLITAYIIDGGAPIAVISKLVGHSNLVMTIYYTKLNSSQMRKIMGEAEKRAEQLVVEQRADDVRIHGLAPLRGQLIATDGNRHLLDADIPNSACVVFDHGICPMSCSACDEGGTKMTEEKNPAQNRYSPVEAGYLGKKNCPRCRFFMTGVPFLGGLVALANEVALESHIESQRYQDFTSQVEQLEQEYYDACQNNLPDTQQSKRKSAVAFQQQSAGKLDGLLNDYIAINRYVQDCIKLINEGENDENGVRLVAASDPQQLTVAYEESETQYHLLAEICQNATIYQSSNPSRAVPLIAEAIDRMAENNGLAPSMFRLTQEQKLVVANELNRLLLQRLGSWEKIDELFSGDLMLLDIDAHEPELTRISTEIRQILSPSKVARQISHKVMDYE